MLEMLVFSLFLAKIIHYPTNGFHDLSRFWTYLVVLHKQLAMLI